MIKYVRYEDYDPINKEKIYRVDAIDKESGNHLQVLYRENTGLSYEDAERFLKNKLLSK